MTEQDDARLKRYVDALWDEAPDDASLWRAAQAVTAIADQEQTMLRAETEMWHDALITMATTLSRAETRAEAAETELAETRQRLALALDALASAVDAADTGRSPDQERLVLNQLGDI